MSLPPTCGSMNDLPLGALISVHFNPSWLVANCKPAWPLGSRKKEKRNASEAWVERESRQKRNAAKSEIRNPKSERNPKAEIRNVLRTPIAAIFRASDFGFLSDFGFRISDFTSRISLLPVGSSWTVLAQKMFG